MVKAEQQGITGIFWQGAAWGNSVAVPEGARPTCVAFDLAGNGAGRPLRAPSRLLDPKPVLLPLIDERTFPCGHAFVSHFFLHVLVHLMNAACRVTFFISRVLQ
jgi:hypothetical protein